MEERPNNLLEARKSAGLSRSKAAENSQLAIISNDLRTFFSVVLIQLHQTLN